jgi:anti-sigma regulatory factor (Ser/Thr protein kinase)
MRAPRRFERTLVSDHNEISRARRWLSDCLECLPAGARGVIPDMALVLGELLTNSVRHAYGPDVPGRIDVILEVGAEDVRLAVRDFGRSFDLSARREPDLSRANEAGYGLFLVRMLTDDLHIDSPGGAGNRVAVRRRLPSAIGARVADSRPLP